MRGHTDGWKLDTSKRGLGIRKCLSWKGHLWEQPSSSKSKLSSWPQDKFTKLGERNEVVCLSLMADTELSET